MLPDRLWRVGIDVDAYVGPVNVIAMWLYGRNSNPGAAEVAEAQSYYGGFFGADLSVFERLVLSARYDGVRFRGGEVHHEEGAEGVPPDPEPAHHEAEAHLHGELVRSNTDALVFGANYMLTWQIRVTTEFREAFGGVEDRWIAGFQFAF